jgi:hypothetical protein
VSSPAPAGPLPTPPRPDPASSAGGAVDAGSALSGGLRLRRLPPPPPPGPRFKGYCPHCGRPYDLPYSPDDYRCLACKNLVGARGPAPQAQPIVPAAFGTGQAPPCARHAENAAVTACARCGDFMCAVCVTPVEGSVVCVRCFELKLQRGELWVQHAAFNLPDLSLWIGLAGIVVACGCGWVVSPSAIILGVIALREIRRQPGLPGEGKSIAGIILGAMGILEMAALWTWIVRAGREPG